MFQDVEYRRVDDISLADEPDPRARWFWILTLLVFFINTVAILSELGYFIDEALHQNIQSYYFLPLILSLFGQATLANGLFGRVHRGVSLHMYVIFFEYIPGFLFSTALLIFVCGYRTMRDAIQKIVEEHQWHVHATTLMIWLLLLTAFLAVYHLLAGWIVYRYRKLPPSHHRSEMFADVEYRKVDTTVVNNPIDPRVKVYRTLALLVFIINIVTACACLGFFISEGGRSDSFLSMPSFPFIFSTIALVLLANGLFGTIYPDGCLLVYVILFKFVPGLLYTVAFFVYVFGYQKILHGNGDTISWNMWQVHATTLMKWLLLLTAFLAIFHFLAGWVVYRYRTIRQQYKPTPPILL